MCVCARQSVVSGDDELDLRLEGLYQSRLVHLVHQHTHTRFHRPTEAVWLCKNQVEVEVAEGLKTPFRLILIDRAKRRLFVLPLLSDTDTHITAAAL